MGSRKRNLIWMLCLNTVRLYGKSNTYSKAGILKLDDISMIFSGHMTHIHMSEHWWREKKFFRVGAYLDLKHVKECPVL